MLELSDLFPDDDFESQFPGPFDQDKPKPPRQRGRKQAVVRQQLALVEPPGGALLDLDSLFEVPGPPEPVRVIMLQQGRRPANLRDGMALFRTLGRRYRKALLTKIPPFGMNQPKIDYGGGAKRLYLGCAPGGFPHVGSGTVAFGGVPEWIKAAFGRWRRTKAARKWTLKSYCDLFGPDNRGRPAEAFLRYAIPEDGRGHVIPLAAESSAAVFGTGVPEGYVEAGIRLVAEGASGGRRSRPGRWTLRLSRMDTGRQLPAVLDALVGTAAALGAGDGKLVGVRMFADPEDPLAVVHFEGPSNWGVGAPMRDEPRR